MWGEGRRWVTEQTGCAGSSGAGLNEEREESEQAAGAWKNHPSDPTGLGLTFKNPFHTPNLTFQGK